MSEAQWYVVHTYSGYENKVKVDIEKTIENRGLQDQILEVSVPLEEVIELKNGAQKQVERKMFPGYVLILTVNESRQSLTINVEMFGRETPVELNFSEVKKM